MKFMVYVRVLWIMFFISIEARNISINKDPTGEIGSNGTFVECLIDMDGIFMVHNVGMFASINGTMIHVITFLRNGRTELTEAGNYLRGRVVYNTITSKSNRTVMYFSQLLCEDDTEYQCRLSYIPDPVDQLQHMFSGTSHLIVTVKPLKPTELTVRKLNGKALKKNVNVDDLRNLTFVEGDTVLATCRGDVGIPPTNLTMQKILSNGSAYSLTPYNNPVNTKTQHCSFYQTSLFTTTLAEQDNGSKLRCTVRNINGLFKEISHINVQFPVHTPVIYSFPSYPNEKPPKKLHCQSKGNPEPEYTWLRLSSTEYFYFYASTQNITLKSIAEGGVYRCEVNNTIGQVTYRKTRNVMVVFVDRTGDPNAIGSCDLKTCNKVPAILGGVFGTLGVCVVAAVIVYLCQNRRNRRFDDGNQMASKEDVDMASNYAGVNGENTNDHYSELQYVRERPYNNTLTDSTQ